MLAVSLLFVVVTGCDPNPSSVRGNITGVQAQGILEWDSLTLRDNRGRSYIFVRGEAIDLRFWRASHLREHMNNAETVTVHYKQTSQYLVAVAITD